MSSPGVQKWKVLLRFPFWRFRGKKKKNECDRFGNFSLRRIISRLSFSSSDSIDFILKMITFKMKENWNHSIYEEASFCF